MRSPRNTDTFTALAEVRLMEPSRSVMASALTLGLLLSGALAGCGSTTANGPAPAPATSTTTSVERNAGSVLDTRLEITNKTGLLKMLKLWSGCVDLESIFAKEVNAIPIVSVGRCAIGPADVGGDFGTGVWPFYPNNRWVTFGAANPMVGSPWIAIDGLSHSFSTGETCAFKTQGQIFEAERRPDRSGAKDFALRWVTTTTIPDCD